MLAPTAPTLRPLSIGELLDQAIRLYRRNFVTFVGIIAVVQIPYTLLTMLINIVSQTQFAQSFNAPDSANLGALVGAQALTYLLILVELILVQGIGTAALTRAVADNYLGRQTSILEAYQRIGRSWLGLLGALVLLGLLGAGFGLWMIVPCVGWLTGIGMVFFLSVSVRPLLPAVFVVENVGAVRSIRRAWDLAKRRFWWLLGFVLLVSLFGILLIYGPTTLLNLFLQRVMGVDFMTPYANPQALVINLIISGLIGLITSLLYLPLQLTVTTLAYFDLRVRTEGFDLSMLAANVSTDQTEIARTAPTAPNESFITWRDMGNFFALSLMGGVLYMILFGILFAIGSMATGVGIN